MASLDEYTREQAILAALTATGKVAVVELAAGILILEGYGLTETCPILASNHPGAYKFGTVGRPFAGIDVKIAEDGEILARGPNIAHGY